jgi:hypothetical protein
MVHPRTISKLCGVLLFVSPSLLHPQEGNSSSQRTYDIRGTVVNSVTHAPIARALVTLAGNTSNSQLTDNEGQFEFSNVQAGRSMLEARRPGFFGVGRGRDSSMPISIGPAGNDYTLTLEPASTISGQITLPASEPSSNIRVQLMHRVIQDGRASWQPFGMKTTNSEGAFRFGELEPGDYKLFTSNSMDSDIAGQGEITWGYPSVWYPEESDSGGAGFLKLGPGQQLNAQLALAREPFYCVTISVTDRRPIGFVQFSNESGRLNDIPISYDSRQQQFRAYVPSGSYTVMIQSSMPSPEFANVPVTVRNAPVHLQGISALPIRPISVTIHKEFASTNNGAPQIIQIENGKQVEVSRDINLMLFSVTNHEAMGVTLRHEPGGDDSSWVMEGMQPGRYWVQTYANEGYVASITAGGTDLVRDPLVIGQGGTSAPIDILLRNDMARLSVRAKNLSSVSENESSSGGPFSLHPPLVAPLGYLYVIPQFDTPSVLPQSMPLQQAAFTVNLQPGTYRVLALDHPVDLEYRNPKAMEVYAGKGQTVTLEPNGTANLEVDVIPVEVVAP